MSQGIYWLLTIPQHEFTPYLPAELAYIKGQLECGADTGYLHWQVLAVFNKKCRLAFVKRIFGNGIHAELTKSKAANDYVWKDETRVDGTQFELGQLKFKRNCETDWAAVLDDAKRGRMDDIPPDIIVRHYGNLRRIGMDHLAPVAVERRIIVYWGPSGTGKSRRAWNEAGLDAYPKDPLTKFWDGYRGQENVVIDEFRGGVSIGHVLRWFDRYPVNIEVKGAAVTLRARTIWITSNLAPDQWYPDLDQDTKAALLRRLEVHHASFDPESQWQLGQQQQALEGLVVLSQPDYENMYE
jgi:hypothetical protein